MLNEQVFLFIFILIGNRVGDVCESDRDLDGVVNNFDVCFNNKDISFINFIDYIVIDFNLILILEKVVVWYIMDKGREVRQIEIILKFVVYIGG